MGEFFDVIFYEPIFNGLMALYRWLPGQDMGLAIIVLTIVIRAILIWPSMAQIRSSRALQEVQPKLKALQKQYGNDRQALARETMKLYKEHRVNPLSSCLPLLIQLPFLLTVYQVFNAGVRPDAVTHLLGADQLQNLYGPLRDFYAHTPIDTISFGFLDVARNHNIILAILVAGTQYIQTKMLTPKASPPTVPGAQDEQMATALNRQMTIIFPLVTGWLSYTLPTGLGLYFLTFNIFASLQQWWVIRKDTAKTTTVVEVKPGG